ncbi:hypothetical protein HDA30_000198 [Micrococcus cohnii]|uniref:Uncharacterized protein n=1 Tax=Micrococcus cohnii TaxID=993416 RepID=A0A7W7GM81_9MICC|nr:hypothetical protein [Micrococcus cohnii]
MSVDLQPSLADQGNDLLTQRGARELTDQIKTGMESVWHLIRAAYRGRAWEAIGYHSWDEYVTREFGNLYLRPPLEERQNVVLSLREAGMSTRAIVSATQLSIGTVHRELRSAETAGVPNGTPEDEEHTRVLGVDGKEYQPARPQAPKPAVEAVEEDIDIDAVLDMPAEEFGVEPLDMEQRDKEEAGRARRVLTAFNGSGAAAVPALIKAAAPMASLVSPATGEAAVSDEELHGVVWDSARCVRTLANVIQSVGRVKGESTTEIQSTLRDAVDDLDTVLKRIEEVEQ